MGVVVDTSAVMALLLEEDDADVLLDHLVSASPRVMSAGTRLELGIVAEARLGPIGADLVARLLRDTETQVLPFDADGAARALTAWRRFGKGRHRAALNYGDCFSYALAELTGFPLLCTGRDFASTDLAVLPPV